MARARAIETRLEKLVPALDEYFSSGFLTREEVVEVSRQRTHWEYRLVAKPLLFLDVRGAITYELGLEKRLREYCIHTKLNLQHRWAILERIEGIYKIGLSHLKNRKEHEALRQEYVLFLKQFQRNGSLSNLYGELMVTYPRRSDIWIEAAEWQATSQHNTDNARAIVQQALLTTASEPAVWACALRVELQFVQRLLDGLLAEHREEVRKARKKAASTTPDGDDKDGEEEEEQRHAAAGEPTSVIAPKLRAENEAMGHVLLDLALAKAVVEEALDSPASGAALVEQLLSTAGSFAFAKEVMELVVTTAMRKMLEACFSSEAVGRGRAAGTPSSASLSIVSHQQQLRVRAQWSHPHSIDTMLAAYLSLEDTLVNKHSTAIVDVAAYLADGGSDAVERAQQRRTAQQRKKGVAYAEFSFANPSPAERRHAATKALVALITFSSLPPSAWRGLPGLASADDATQRFPAVRHALIGVLSRTASMSADGASKVCAALLRGSLVSSSASSSTAGKAAAAKESKKKKAAAPSCEMADVARWVLQQSTLDAATEQTCVAEPEMRVQRLMEEVASVAAASPPPKTRARHEAATNSSGDSASGNGACLLAWSVVQLERFVQVEDREELRGGMTAATSSSSSSSTTATGAASASPLSAEEVERLVLWWKEEEAAVAATADDEKAVEASRARRRLAVVELLQRHALLPRDAVPATTKSASGKKAASAKARAADGEAWPAVETALLTRSSALRLANNTSAASAIPLSMWRVFSALEAMEGPLPEHAPSRSAKATVSSSDEDDDDDASSSSSSPPLGMQAGSTTRLSSFAAAGLYLLSGIPHSTLSREQEWLRLEGVTSLLRCRLASWLGRRVCMRDAVAAALQSATPSVAESWIADVQSLLALAKRCEPLPRLAHTHCVLPFLEGLALYRLHRAGDGAAAMPAGTARDAVQAAREAHEALLKLYGVSKHPESFVPLIFDGTSAKHLASSASAATGKASTVAVQQANADDWVAYVVFERAVSKDLLKAKAVVEQGRRAALSPQLFMVKLNAM